MSIRFDPAVNALLDENKHPLRKELDRLRTIILDADDPIVEGVKWNAASFRTTEWFATLNGPKQVKEATIILHAGAKAKGTDVRASMTDPSGMIKWLGADRGMITFSSTKEIEAKQKELTALIRAWIALI
ncbi:MAG: DUF1801 domain-containing protein [Flavobacteriales bacterium]|jgi:hypothetical protein|nr:DUF1801 domain-containing protein [Flavobacteriales bacterium]